MSENTPEPDEAEYADDEVEDLDPDADPDPELGDHPDEVTDEEAEQGQRMWESIDDNDDKSSGVE